MNGIRFRCAVVGLVWTAASASMLAAAESACDPGEFWVINTRCVTDHCRMGMPIERFRVQRLDGCCWRRASMQEFLATSGAMPTVIHVHGNGLDHSKAMEFAHMFRNGLKRQTAAPFRFVLWSWPADEKKRGYRGLYKRFRYHAFQAEVEGFHMARVIERMRPGAAIGFTGHSLGAVGTLATLHALGGGAVRGHALASATPLPLDIRGAVFGAGVDNDAILPGHRAGRALKGGRLLLLWNPCDSMLPRWPKISARGRPALGLTGVPCPHLLGEDIHRLTVVNSGRFLGKGHGSKDHFSNTCVLRTLADYFFSPAPVTGPAVETVETEVVETEVVEPEVVETEVVEAETVEAETVEAETVEAETVEAETEAVETETPAVELPAGESATGEEVEMAAPGAGEGTPTPAVEMNPALESAASARKRLS